MERVDQGFGEDRRRYFAYMAVITARWGRSDGNYFATSWWSLTARHTPPFEVKDLPVCWKFNPADAYQGRSPFQ